MKIKAYGKINSQLLVYPKKKHQVLHDIGSIMFPYKKLYDVISINYNDEKQFIFKSNVNIENNSVLRIYNKFINLYHPTPEINVTLELWKNNIIGSGLGFSASDAVATIKLLSKFFNVNITEDYLSQLMMIAGSDGWFFWFGKPAFVYNYGQKIKLLSLKEKQNYNLPHFNVICNNISSVTKDVYHELDRDFSSYYQNMQVINQNYYNILMLPALAINKKLNYEYLILKEKYHHVMLSGAGSAFIVWN